MTVYSIGHHSSPSTGIFTPLEPGLLSRRRGQVNETVTLRCCALYRRAFRGVAVAYPGAALRSDAVANWTRRAGVHVDVTSLQELGSVLAAGIPAVRIVMHCANGTAETICGAVNLGVSRFILDSPQHIGILSSSTKSTRRVLVDVTAHPVDDLACEVADHARLALVGLHHRLGDDDVGCVVRGMIAQMARLRRRQGDVLTRISLADFDGGERDVRKLRRAADTIDEAIDDACERYRYPRPVLSLSPSPSALMFAP